jgi:hypothetical protein
MSSGAWKVTYAVIAAALTAEPNEVSLHRDFWDWLAVLSAPIAILLAGLAIWLSWRIDRKTANRLVLEAGRGMDLQVLLYLLEAADDDRCLNVDQTARLEFFATVELPTWHALWDGIRAQPLVNRHTVATAVANDIEPGADFRDLLRRDVWRRRSGGAPVAKT